MKALQTPTNAPSPFTVSMTNPTENATPEELEAKANEMLAAAKNAKRQAELDRVAKLEQSKSYDFETLANLRKEVAKLEFVEKGTTDPDKRGDIFGKIIKYKADIQEIEERYGLNQKAEVVAEPIERPNSSAVLVTALKIAALILACWGIVLYSGDWIVEKYPNAAIYNEVSFQKVLFAFSVFIGGFVSVIIALNVFFPGFGRYFNPFNHNSLDFFDDFQTLNPWQRNIVSIALFFCLLFAFVLIVGGKLD
jgi:hypothetical protein